VCNERIGNKRGAFTSRLCVMIAAEDLGGEVEKIAHTRGHEPIHIPRETKVRQLCDRSVFIGTCPQQLLERSREQNRSGERRDLW
jgi:hypothetical protein